MTHTPPSTPTDDRMGRIVAQLDATVARFQAVADANAAAIAAFAAAVDELRPAHERVSQARVEIDGDGTVTATHRDGQTVFTTAHGWLDCGCHGTQRDHTCGPRETYEDEA